MDSTRRCLGAVAARCTNLRFIYSIAVTSVISGKLSHIYAHLPALTSEDLLHWGLSFFAQDAVLLLVLHLLLSRELYRSLRWLRIIVVSLASFFVFILLALAAIDISFFITAGTEIHWRNVGVATDAQSRKMMMTGMLSCAATFLAIVVASWILQDLFFFVTTLAINILKWPITFVWNKLPFSRSLIYKVRYAHIPQREVESAEFTDRLMKDSPKDDDDEAHLDRMDTARYAPVSKLMAISYGVVGLFMLLLFIETVARPEDGSLSFMSWTLPLLPFVDFAHASPTLAKLLPVHGNGINYSWDNQTALAKPYPLRGLPKTAEPLPGFEDWHGRGKVHYNGNDDPMRIPNLQLDVLSEIKDKLYGVDIKNVVLIKLESTRKDIFPIRKDDFIWKKLADSWKDKKLPEEAQKKLSTLTPTANYLTGDYNDGFPHEEQPRRGGINFNNAFTTATYTLKSLTGTFCGAHALVADFNVEPFNHLWQPCLPHIFNAMNLMDKTGDNKTAEGYQGKNWTSSFMMSVTGRYDKQNVLMDFIGFPEEGLIDMEYLRGENPKFGKIDQPDLHYFGGPEYALDPYIRDVFRTAKEKDERVFFSHLTSTTHHPFKIPENETYVTMAEKDEKLEELSHYLNAVGFDDAWLGHLLKILDEEGVANETLIVFAGDHGLSVAEYGTVTPYFATNQANFHVPLIFSHPQLPAFDVNAAVSSISILPTILDLLLETGSLSDSESRFAQDLVQNYEGQSLIRPQVDFNEHTGQPLWQFTVMNPGRAMLAVRDARQPNWRLIVPIIDDLEWRFSDMTNDTHELEPILTFGFKTFIKEVEKQHSLEASKWAEEAAFMSRWWVEENSKRWQYDP